MRRVWPPTRAYAIEQGRDARNPSPNRVELYNGSQFSSSKVSILGARLRAPGGQSNKMLTSRVTVTPIC